MFGQNKYAKKRWKELTSGYDKKRWLGRWKYFEVKKGAYYTGWKIHVFADSMKDLLDVGEHIIGFLKNKKLCWKTYKKLTYVERVGGYSKGKAFTIYICQGKNPRDINKVREVARWIVKNLDSLLKDIPNSHAKIQGDKKVPGTSSNRLWYRYDGKEIGPGPDVGYVSAKDRGHYNLKGNPDIF